MFRVLAVTGPERLAAIPDVPTTTEAGFPKFVAMGWTSLMAPARTPPAALATLRNATTKFMATKEFQDYLSQRGMVPRPRGANEIGEAIRIESAVWEDIIRTTGIKLD